MRHRGAVNLTDLISLIAGLFLGLAGARYGATIGKTQEETERAGGAARPGRERPGIETWSEV